MDCSAAAFEGRKGGGLCRPVHVRKTSEIALISLKR